MKRFLTFAYDKYYPCGGWYDFEMDFDTSEEAKTHILTLFNRHELFQIIDTETMKINSFTVDELMPKTIPKPVDIKWRELNDETADLIKKNPDSTMLIQTSIALRTDLAQYITTTCWPWRLRTACEDVIRVAFID